MNNCGVYVIRNKTNGHRYIGSSVNVYRRWTGHRCNLRHGVGSTYLQRAWDKYGEEYFEFIFLLECQKEELHRIEQLQFDTYNPEYNLARVAGGGSLPGVHIGKTPWNKGKTLSPEQKMKIYPNGGKPCSDETKRKISLAHTGMVCSDETRKKMSVTRKGRPLPEKTRVALIAANTGKHHSEETKKKISNAKMGKPGHPMSEENKRKLIEANKNRIITDELRVKLGRAHLGCKHSDETRAKMSLSRQKYLAKEIAHE